MKTVQPLLLISFALMALSSSDAVIASVEGRVVVPGADCSVTVIWPGGPCDPHNCETECRKEHGGMGACAAEGCSCAVCTKYPPSYRSLHGNR